MAAMTAQEALERGKNLDFEKVWAMFVETDRKFAETDRKFVEAAEQFQEIGRRQAKTDEQLTRLEKTVERVSGNVGGLNVSMGELVETLIAPHLAEKFEAWNYNLKRIFHRVYIYDDAVIQRGEIDILLSDTTVCMAVEVKRWLEKMDQVDEHIKRMQLIRKYPPAETKGKRLLGAIAGAVVTPEAREYAEKNGFFVLELTGEDVRLLESEKNFQPKE
jgi:predicted nuclease with TOPRIM domain